MIDLPAHIDHECWQGFEDMRKLIKKPMTDRARKLLLGRLEKIRQAGHCPNAALDQSTLKNWDSVYEPRELEVSTKAAATGTDAYLAEQSAHVAQSRAAGVPQEIKMLANRLRRVA